MTSESKNRVLSGMRPTGRLHLGHYHGVLKNWVNLQHEYDCFFFVADWHALTTHYEDPQIIGDSVMDMVIDWLAVGVNPANARIFVQSEVPQHAELHLLLSMLTPLGWLERPLMKWNGNPYSLRGDNGASEEGASEEGASEEAGTFWLLPYWMGRYYGFI